MEALETTESDKFSPSLPSLKMVSDKETSSKSTIEVKERFTNLAENLHEATEGKIERAAKLSFQGFKPQKLKIMDWVYGLLKIAGYAGTTDLTFFSHSFKHETVLGAVFIGVVVHLILGFNSFREWFRVRAVMHDSTDEAINGMIVRLQGKEIEAKRGLIRQIFLSPIEKYQEIRGIFLEARELWKNKSSEPKNH